MWDLQLQEAGKDPVTVVAGKFDAVLDVTRVGAAAGRADPIDYAAEP